VVIDNFEELREYMLEWCKRIGRLPSRAEINEDEKLKSQTTLSRWFKKHTDKSMANYFEELGFMKYKRETKFDFETVKKELLGYAKKSNRVPTVEEISKYSKLPSSTRLNFIFRENINITYTDYLKNNGYKTKEKLELKIVKLHEFDNFKVQLVDTCKKLGRIPTTNEFGDVGIFPYSYHVVSYTFGYYGNIGYLEFLKSKGYETKDIIDRRLKYNSLFEKIKLRLLELCNEFGYIPTREDMEKDSIISERSYSVDGIFASQGYEGYHDFCLKQGFDYKRTKSKYTDMVVRQLEEIWKKYYDENGRYPNSVDCNKDSYLPTWQRVKHICGEGFYDFYVKYTKVDRLKGKGYDFYCEKFKRICGEIGRTLTTSDLFYNNFELPTARWLVKHCPDDNIRDYNQFINYLELKPYYGVSKEYAISMIRKKRKEVDRNLMVKDFADPSGNEVGIGTITRIWGSFNNMLEGLGYEVNQTGGITLHKETNEMLTDIYDLCSHINEKYRRKIIAVSDLNECDWCSTYSTYQRIFKKELNMSLREVIMFFGFDMTEAGLGMYHKFEDGEETHSKYEFNTSKFFKDCNIKYTRDVNYSDFILPYDGLKNCDYVVNINEETIYLEIAGMLDEEKINFNRLKGRHKYYKKGLDEKIKMLQENKLNYHILYPPNFNKSIEDTYSFLNINSDLSVS